MSEAVEPLPVSLAAIEDARRQIVGSALRTPLVRLNTLDAPAEIYLKLENLQPIGSFKIRGATNALAHIPNDQLRRGVLTASAGNMAQGVAWRARELDIPCTVVAPETAPEIKLQAIERLGYWNRRSEQCAHFACECGNLLSRNPPAQRGRFYPRRDGTGGRARLRPSWTQCCWSGLKTGREQATISQHPQRGFAVFGLNHTSHRRTTPLDCPVAKRRHSSKSPEDTRKISSSEVTPAPAFCTASWCMVIIVFWAVTFSSAFERFCRINSRISRPMARMSRCCPKPLPRNFPGAILASRS